MRNDVFREDRFVALMIRMLSKQLEGSRKDSPPPARSTIRFGAMIVGFVSALMVLAIVGLAAYWSLKTLDGRGYGTARAQARINQTIDNLEALHVLLDEAETRERDYLINGDQYN